VDRSQFIHQEKLNMRKIAYIGLAVATLTATALPARADDQSISFATGMTGGASPPARWNPQPAQTPWRQNGMVQRAAPSPYGDYAQGGGFAQSGAFTQRNCTYVGGPKGDWSCW
jgi:hypothetical protein